jgi:type VI secretion system protein ImpM
MYSVLETLAQSMVSSKLVSAPSLWGKLPSHSDYIHHNAHPVERQALHQWIQDQWRQRPDAPSCELPEEGWHVVERTQRFAWSEVPVIFVIPSVLVPFATPCHVQGVIMASRDKSGRAYPIVLYQKVTASWIERSNQQDLQQLPTLQGTRNWLFWAARLMLQAVAQQQSIDVLQSKVQSLWQHYTPSWRQCLGHPLHPPREMDVRDIVSYNLQNDATQNLNGVTHLPWSDWPKRVTQKTKPQGAFWTQDSQGRYLQAAASLLQLWGVNL